MAINNCPSEGRIQEYIDGELAGEQATSVASHIHSCPRCRGLYQGLNAISQSLADQSPPVASKRLKHRILLATSQTRPVRPLSCRKAQQLISSYLDGELSPQQQEQCPAHIFTCPDCYQIFEQSQRIAASLRAVPPLAVPAELGAQVHRAVTQAAAAGEPQVIGYVGRRISWRTVGVGLAAAAAAAVIVFGLILAPRELLGPQQPPTAVVVQQPVMMPGEEPVAESTPKVTDSTEVAKEPPVATNKALASRRTVPRRPSRLAIASKRVWPALKPEPPGGQPSASEPEPENIPVERTPAAAEPPAAELALVERAEPGPTIVMVRPRPTEPPGPAGPGLAAMPASVEEPAWAPVRTAHRAIYRSQPQVSSERLAAVTDHVNQQIVQLRGNQSAAGIVIK